jgi:TolA-binding protein
MTLGIVNLGALLSLLFIATACATNSEPREDRVSRHSVEDSAMARRDETPGHEQRLAKLWSRVDELDDQVQKQKQRIAVLEKGLLLGIIPDELRNPGDKSSHEKKPHKVISEPASPIPLASAEPVSEQSLSESSAKREPEQDTEKMLLEAQQFFERGQYGRAIALYSAVDDNKHEDMSHRYWIGLSWFRLKEFDTAQREFNELLSRAPTSPWAPRTRYYLAQVDLELGLKEKALDKLQKIIEEYPNEDAAQMARASIDKMEKNL